MDSGNITSIANGTNDGLLTSTSNTTLNIGGAASSGSATTANTTGYYLNGTWYPYYNSYPYWGTYTYTTPSSDIQIRKASNGFIVISKGVEHVFETAKKMNAFLNKELGKK